MNQNSASSDQVKAGFSRIDAAVARIDAAAQKAKVQHLATAQETVALEVHNERLREAVGEALAQIDGLIAKVEGAS